MGGCAPFITVGTGSSQCAEITKSARGGVAGSAGTWRR
jgi:hypothetical protein